MAQDIIEPLLTVQQSLKEIRNGICSTAVNIEIMLTDAKEYFNTNCRAEGFAKLDEISKYLESWRK